MIVIHGSNGAGKTNILEAVSLLSPGRGLRGAKLTDIQNNKNPDNYWAVSANVETQFGAIKIGCGIDPGKGKRTVRVQGETSSQSALSEYLSCVWLTPQMDGLFIDSASSRRKFLDRLIFAFDPAHAGRITRYEKAMRSRNKLLQDNHYDPAWVDGLEASMAESGVAISAIRNDFIERLQTACHQSATQTSLFPGAILQLSGTIEELLRHGPAIDVEHMMRHQLKESRSGDAQTGTTSTGPHKTDMLVTHKDKNMAAALCSTGEQKALLIGLTLAHSRLIAAERDAPPILLLDEIAAHLDDTRRAGLYELLENLGGQVWLTGTDKSLFDSIRHPASTLHIENSKINIEKNEKWAAA